MGTTWVRRAARGEPHAPAGVAARAAAAEKTGLPRRSYPGARPPIYICVSIVLGTSPSAGPGGSTPRGRPNAPGPAPTGLPTAEKTCCPFPPLPCSEAFFEMGGGAAAAASPDGMPGGSPRRSRPNAPHEGRVRRAAAEKPGRASWREFGRRYPVARPGFAGRNMSAGLASGRGEEAKSDQVRRLLPCSAVTL